MTIEGEKRRASPDSLADEMASPKRMELSHPHVSDEDEPMEEVVVNVCTLLQDEDEPMEEVVVNTTAFPEKIEEPLTYYKEVMGELIHDYDVRRIADEAINCDDIVELLEGFLRTLDPVSKSTITNHDLQQHFDKVKDIWGNKQFLGFLMKMADYIPDLCTYGVISRACLSSFIVPKIRKEKHIFENKDLSTMMRNALSILIGYWSNEDTIYLMLSIGGRSLGRLLNIVKVEDVLPWGEEVVSGNKMSGELSTLVEGMTIEELRNDASIRDLADQLSEIPVAVRLAENYMAALKGDLIRDTTSYNYHASHCVGASCFWDNSVVLTALIKALRKSTPLVNIFTKYSKRAQLLRCLDRLTRIQKDSFIKGVLEGGDRAHRMRGALSVLFGYWVDYDVCELFRKLLVSGWALKQGDIKVVEYFREGLGDFKGLENVLAEKYSEGSEEYLELLQKIRNYQEIEEQKSKKKKKVYMIEFPDIPDMDGRTSALIRVLSQNSNVKWMEILGL